MKKEYRVNKSLILKIHKQNGNQVALTYLKHNIVLSPIKQNHYSRAKMKQICMHNNLKVRNLVPTQLPSLKMENDRLTFCALYHR